MAGIGWQRSGPLGAVEGAAQEGEGDRAPDQRQPEQDDAVGEHGRGGRCGRGAVDDQRADQPAVDAPHAAGEREQPAELADQVAHHHDGDRNVGAEGLEGGPQDRVVEGPVADRAGDDLADRASAGSPRPRRCRRSRPAGRRPRRGAASKRRGAGRARVPAAGSPARGRSPRRTAPRAARSAAASGQARRAPPP